MKHRRTFERKPKSGASAAPVTKKFTAPTSGLGDVYFTWGTVSNTVRYTEVVDKLKEYVLVHFCGQATVAAKTMEEL